MPANKIIAARYEADDGTFFVTGLNEEHFDLMVGDPATRAVGGQAAGEQHTLYPLPRQLRPRHAVLAGPGGRSRKLIALSPTAPILTKGTVVAIEDSGGVPQNYTVVKARGEEYRRRTKQPV